MPTKLLLSTLATAALVFAAPAFSAEEKTAESTKEVHCDKTKDKDCKDEHDHSKDGGKGHKAGDKHDDDHDHSKDEKKK